MKSFDARLQHDLFPKTPAAFDKMIQTQLENVCGGTEAPQSNAIPFPTAEDKKPAKETASRFWRFGTVAVAAVLVICTLAVGTVAVLAGRSKQTPVAAASEQPQATAESGGTDARGTLTDATPTPSAAAESTAAPNTVLVTSAEEFLAAIAPHTEIALSAATYDLSMAAASYTGDNPYVSVENGDRTDDRFLKITGVDGLSIRVPEDAECILITKRCAAVLAMESCSGVTLKGLTFRGDEEGVRFENCSDVRVESCAFDAPYAIGVNGCEHVTLTNLTLAETGLALNESKDVTVSDVDFSNCNPALSIDSCADVLVQRCRIHDLRDDWDAEPLPGEEGGEASYLIQLWGQSDNVLSATFRDCEICNSKCTFFLSSDGVDAVTLSGLNIHDSCFDRLFDFDATSESAGSHVIVNCDVDRNKIGTFLFCGRSDTKIRLSGTSIVDNEIENVFTGGDITVSGCLFASPSITHLIGVNESYDDLKTFLHDANGNALDETALDAMTLERDVP